MSARLRTFPPRRRWLARAVPLVALALVACGDEPAPTDPGRAAPEPEAVYEPRPPGTLTFADPVAGILHQHCAACHRPGGAAPFSLLDFADAGRRARFLASVVDDRTMPPWPPEPGYGHFEDARLLSVDEIGMLRQWAEEGAPQGDPSLAPEPPTFSDDWALGEPDVVLTMREVFELPADGTDVFRHFVLPIPVDEDRYVRGFEFRPGNAPVVHHARMYLDTHRRSRRLDEADPEPGFEEMIVANVADPDGHWMGWTPGKRPTLMPPERGWFLPQGSDLILELHLVPTGKVEPIQSSIGLYFSDEKPTQIPVIVRVGPKDLDLPAGDANHVVRDEFVLPVDVEVINVYAHAHLLGKRAHGWAELPDGSRQWLLRIDEWNFGWQDEYRYVEPPRLPAGSKLVMEFTFDNSADNPWNPFSPPQRVTYGMFTSTEMADLWFQVVAKDEADRRELLRTFQGHELQHDVASDRQALGLDESNGETHLSIAASYELLQRTGEALRHYARAAELLPDDVRAPYNRGYLLSRLGRSDEAIASLERAVEIDPRHPESQRMLGLLLANARRFEEAILHHRAAIRERPEYAEAHNDLGVALQSIGRNEEAMGHFQQAIRFDPKLSEAHSNLGIRLMAIHAVGEATQRFREAVRLDPERWFARFNLGNALLTQKLHAEALAEFQAAVDLNPRAAGAFHGIALCYDALGNRSQAQIHIRLAAKLAPNDPRVRADSARLGG